MPQNKKKNTFWFKIFLPIAREKRREKNQKRENKERAIHSTG